MKQSKKNFPALRFPEFDGNWDTKTLGEITDTFKSGIGITSEKIFTSGEYPVYGGNGLRGYTDSYTHEGHYVLIGRQGALCGNINIANGKSYISEHAIAVKGNRDTDNAWLAFKLDKLQLNRLSESSAQPGLAVNKLVKLKIQKPSLPEQQKIASFLTAVDDKIQQLTKKKELLEQYKKGVMQKLFSQEVRFKDDNGMDFPEWDEKRLGEFAKVATGNTPPTQDLDNYGGEYLFVSPGDFTNRPYINDTVKKLSKTGFDISRKFPAKSILFTCIGSTIGKLGISQIELTSNQQINAILPNSNFSSEYVYYSLLYIAPRIRLLAGTQAVPLINKSEFERIKIKFPRLAEQKKIAQLLFSIDSKIAKVESRVIKTQQFKKGLLQQMFV